LIYPQKKKKSLILLKRPCYFSDSYSTFFVLFFFFKLIIESVFLHMGPTYSMIVDVGKIAFLFIKETCYFSNSYSTLIQHFFKLIIRFVFLYMGRSYLSNDWFFLLKKKIVGVGKIAFLFVKKTYYFSNSYQTLFKHFFFTTYSKSLSL